jgi:hypothetical protein
MASTEHELPDLASIIGPVLQRVTPEEQPLLVALAERLAAERYREWARRVTDPSRAAGLRACAEREEEIAARVEALFADPAALQRDILGRNPDLEEINRALFAGRPLEQQLAIQARGERLGAATWRAFGRQTTDATARETFAGCAGLEEESPVFLESLLERSS